MKKIISLCLGTLLLIWGAFAYQPTMDDVTVINNLRAQLDTVTTGNMQGKAKLYIQLKNLQEQFSGHDKLTYYLNILDIHLITQVHAEKTKAKIISKSTKQDFVNQYSGGFSKDITTADSCTGRYNTIDSISFANNFPTALTIATRFRETNCGYYLPNDGDGPFQIRSKDYGTGEITEGKFLTTIQDFIDFSKAKHTPYKTKLWINLTYTGFDMTGLVNHAALYNGATITGSTESWHQALPNNPSYVYDGYGEAYSWATRYGIIPKFLKILDWELQNTY